MTTENIGGTSENVPGNSSTGDHSAAPETTHKESIGESQGSQGSLDIESAAKGIASELFGKRNEDTNEIEKSGTDEPGKPGKPGKPDEPDEPGIEKDGKTSNETGKTKEAEGKDKTETALKDEAQTKKPPTSWAKEKHDLWAKADPAIQEYIELREKQMHEGVQKHLPDATFGRQLKEIAQPYMATLTAQGVDAPKAVTWLLNNHQILSTSQPHEKAHHFAELARKYGVDLSLVTRGTQSNGQAPASDGQQDQGSYSPVVSELVQRLNHIEMTQLHKEEARKQAEIERLTEQVGTELEQFASNPDHKYFDEVSDDMVIFITNGFPLKEAYDRAVRANPETYKKLLAEASTAQEKAIKSKIKQEAEAAKKLTDHNLGQRNPDKNPTGKNGSLRNLDAALSAAYDQMKAEQRQRY